MNLPTLPTTRDENWKYTDLSVLASKPRVFTQNKIITFKNHTQKGIVITPLTIQPENSLDTFENLNKKFNTENYSITISEDLAQPLEIIYTAQGDEWHQPRIKIIVENNIAATIIEIFESNIPSIINAVTEIEMSSGSNLAYYKIQAEHINTFHIGRTHITLDAKSHVQAFTLSKGSQLARSDIFVTFQGEHASCDLYGLSYSKSRQHLDHHTVIDHAVGHCTSNEFYRSILDDKSRVVFNGKVIVREGAHQTEANQSNHNILLSSEAEIDTKPELEIYHDDVKCTHGATIGQLDDEALFYLRSRGLSEEASRDILIQAFGNKVLQCISDEQLRERLCQY
ncbi:MAG TPA: Fe-S cluster assembly protein SufD [Gammaproteobacteria bacterium]|nr:Fe-S cluster assembly protein SufD [Gammaproteobacteria bacterium]